MAAARPAPRRRGNGGGPGGRARWRPTADPKEFPDRSAHRPGWESGSSRRAKAPWPTAVTRFRPRIATPDRPHRRQCGLLSSWSKRGKRPNLAPIGENRLGPGADGAVRARSPPSGGRAPRRWSRTLARRARLPRRADRPGGRGRRRLQRRGRRRQPDLVPDPAGPRLSGAHRQHHQHHRDLARLRRLGRRLPRRDRRPGAAAGPPHPRRPGRRRRRRTAAPHDVVRHLRPGRALAGARGGRALRRPTGCCGARSIVAPRIRARGRCCW